MYLGIYNESASNENGFMQFYSFHKEKDKSILYYSFKDLFFYVPFRLIKIFKVKFLIPKVKFNCIIDTLIIDSSPWTVIYYKAIIKLFNPKTIIYRQSDPIGEISGSEQLLKAEKSLISISNSVFFVNNLLKKEYKNISRHGIVIRNPQKTTSFSKRNKEKEFKAIYYGKLQIDYEYINELAKLNPNLKIEIFGNYFQSKETPSNLIFKGFQPLEHIYKSLANSMFFLLPYSDENPVVKYLGVSSKIVDAINNRCLILSNKLRNGLDEEGLVYAYGIKKIDVLMYENSDYQNNIRLVENEFSDNFLYSSWLKNVANHE